MLSEEVEATSAKQGEEATLKLGFGFALSFFPQAIDKIIQDRSEFNYCTSQ